MNQRARKIRRAALRYATRGWQVIPVHGIVDGKCTCGQECGKAGKHPRTVHGVKDASRDPAQIEAWFRKWPDSNIGVCTGHQSELVVIDVDGKKGHHSLKGLRKEIGAEAFFTLTSKTGRGRHFVFHSSDPIAGSAGKLRPGIDVRGENGYFVAPPSLHLGGRSYKWDDYSTLIAELPKKLVELAASRPVLQGHKGGNEIPAGQRNTTLTRLAGAMRRPGFSTEAIEAALLVENRGRCSPPLPEQEVRKIAESCARYQPVPYGASALKVDEAALYGLPGEVVRVLEPHSEADPAALLVQTVVTFGNVIGPGPHFIVEADRHGFNLFTVVVGDSAKARKGTSTGQVLRLFKLVDSAWAEHNLQTGLSSGEGFIHALRDRREGPPTRLDKRLLILEPEFGSTLKVLERKGNTLSPVLRQAWDGGPLAVMTRRSPLRASGAHVSLIGHITRAELRAELRHAEVFGGFANRILWVSATRSKVLPFGGTLSTPDLERLAARVEKAVASARKIDDITLSRKSAALWRSVYAELSEGEPGPLGAVTNRAEAQVRRLAGIYALMDCSGYVRLQHLKAALALWRYCHSSAHLIFTGREASTLQERVLAFLEREAAGLTRTEISQRLANHFPAHAIQTALNNLAANGLVTQTTEHTQGRSAIRFLAVRAAAGEQRLLPGPDSKVTSREGM